MRSTFLKHRSVVAIAAPFVFALAFVLSLGLAAQPSFAATPAEQFVSDNVQKGLTILNNTQLSKDQKRAEFRTFLLNLIDIKQIAEYTLGQYKRTASPAELAAFDDAYKDFALALYQPYFTRYSGQTLQVTGSYENAPGETTVRTILIDPAKRSNPNPVVVEFVVVNRGGRFVVTNFRASGVSLIEGQRGEYPAFLSDHGGNMALLTQRLKDTTQQMRNKTEQLNK